MQEIQVSIDSLRNAGNALAIAARSISTSYKEVVTAHQLAEMLRSGEAPERFHPHLMALLDETPLPLVIQAVAEAATSEITTHQINHHLHRWAAAWKTGRDIHQ